MELNGKQREILEFMVKYQEEKGYPPAVREIGAAVGLSSTSTVHGHLSRLEAKGYIQTESDRDRQSSRGAPNSGQTRVFFCVQPIRTCGRVPESEIRTGACRCSHHRTCSCGRTDPGCRKHSGLLPSSGRCNAQLGMLHASGSGRKYDQRRYS